MILPTEISLAEFVYKFLSSKSKLKLDSQIKGLAMIKRKYLEEGSYFFSEIFGKIIINKSVGSIFL